MCRISKKQLNSKLGPDYTLPGRNITSRADTLKHRPDYHYPGWGKACKPAGPTLLIPAGPGSLHPGWPSVPVSPAGPGQRPPAWAVLTPGWVILPPGRDSFFGPGFLQQAGTPPADWDSFSGGPSSVQHPAGPDQEDPAWPGLLSSGRHSQAGLLLFWLGQAGIPLALALAGLRLPWPDLPLLGQDLLPPGYFLHPASTPSPCASLGTPLGSDWHILHRYAGLGTPLGSDQHTLHLLVSLILRRRIRLMTWRSRRQQLEDKAKDSKDRHDGISP
jgi:hypothetical protein